MSRTRLFDFLVVIFLTFFAAVLYTYLNERRVVVEFDIEGDRYTRAKLYWDERERRGLDELRSQSALIIPGLNRVVITSAKRVGSFNTTIDDVLIYPIGHPLRVRIDPMEHPGNFSLLSASVRYMDCILPIISICNYDLLQSKPTVLHQIDFMASDSVISHSLGSDPYLVWTIPAHYMRSDRIYLLNITLLVIFSGSIWLLISMVSTREEKKRLRDHILPALLLFLYPFFSLIESLSINYYYSPSLNKSLLVATVIIYLAALLWQAMRGLTLNRVIRVGLFVSVTGLILPDFLFHLGFIDRWPFGREPKEYHWTLGRSFDDNYLQSSIKYEADLKEIGLLAEKGGVFLSDVATSYYVVATLPIYSRNPHYHHRYPDVFIEKEELVILCSDDTETKNSIIDRLELGYIIINKDRDNRNVAKSCLSRDITSIDDVADRLYQGEYLNLYKIK